MFLFLCTYLELVHSSGRSVFTQFSSPIEKQNKKVKQTNSKHEERESDNYVPNNKLLKQAYQTLVVQLLDNIPCFSCRASDERFLVRSTLQGLLSHFSHDIQLLEEIGAFVFRILVWSNDCENDLRGDD